MNQPDTTLTDSQAAAIYGGSSEVSENSENSEVSENSENSENSGSPDLAELLAQAEQRGYLRGRNEAAEEMMNRPTMWQPTEAQSPAHRMAAVADNFLSGLRPGVWD